MNPASHSERDTLRRWCDQAHQRALWLQQLCEFEGNSTLPGYQDFLQSIQSLLKRTLRPEIRVLLLGPLKSGKSTLLNVLLNNPRLSQISQYPAYPCFIEVRDLDPASSVKGEHAVFFPAVGGPPESPVSLQECRLKLDDLLDRYIRGCDGGHIEYTRVEQRIDLRNSAGTPIDLNGLDFVAIDSPGLFFQRYVDRHVFGVASPDAHEPVSYSGIVENLYNECDVAIFVIRWEQLFFHVVAEYLSRFRRDLAAHRNLRTFVLVNASTEGRVQDENGFHLFDQTAREHREKLTDYFVRHVADDGLLAELQRRTTLSLHFCDLLKLAVKAFDPQAAQPSEPTPSEEVLDQIRGYIFDRDLPRKKRTELEKLLADVELQAAQLLSAGVRDAQDVMENMRLKRELAAEKAANIRLEIGRLAASLAEKSATKQRLLQRQSVIAARTFAQSNDPVILRYNAAHASALAVSYGQTEESPKARVNCQKIFLAWAKGSFGQRTLKNLADRIWHDASVLSPVPSLATMHAKLRVDLAQAQIRILRDQTRDLGGSLYAAALRLDERRVAHLASPPAIVRDPRPLAFHKSRYLFLKWKPEDLWGASGDRVIEKPNEIEILEENKTHFPDQIWGEPWRLSEYFDLNIQKSLLWKALENQLSALWLEELRPEQARLESEMKEISDKTERLGHETAALLGEVVGYDAAITHEQDRIIHLEESLRQLNQPVGGTTAALKSSPAPG